MGVSGLGSGDPSKANRRKCCQAYEEAAALCRCEMNSCATWGFVTRAFPRKKHAPGPFAKTGLCCGFSLQHTLCCVCVVCRHIHRACVYVYIYVSHVPTHIYIYTYVKSKLCMYVYICACFLLLNWGPGLRCHSFSVRELREREHNPKLLLHMLGSFCSQSGLVSHVSLVARFRAELEVHMIMLSDFRLV